MSDKKISQLVSASTLTGSEELPVVQSSTTKKTTTQDVANYTPVGKSYALFSSSIPFVYASSGTMGDNGALSGIAAVSAIYPAAYVYLDANVIFSGSTAGWYFAVFSSTTAATVYNNIYTSGIPVIPSNPTPFVSTGPGAYSRTSIQVLGISFVLPANTLSENGYLEFNFACTQTNNANNKSNYLRANNNTLVSQPIFNAGFINTKVMLANAGNKTTQYSNSICSNGQNYSSAATLYTINTTTNVTFDVLMLSSVATDTTVLNTFTATVTK